MTVISDLKYAIRLLSKKPGFTLLTTLVMATGLGLSVYLFSFMNTMNFKALPFKEGESLVQISASQNGIKGADTINLHDYDEIKKNIKGLSEISAYRTIDANVSGRDGTRRYNAVSVESNIFQLTRTKPILGREFTQAENQMGAEHVTVIGYNMWQNQFGADPQIIDQTLRINGESHRIIGVMPQGYVFPNNTALWRPTREDATHLTRGNAGNVYGLAHLENDVSMQDINRQLAVIMRRIEEKYPETNLGISAYIASIPMAEATNGVLAVIYSLHLIAILVLILAAINVGNLLLSRAIERGKETAIRVALGAPRSHLISQMLWESIIICGVGGIIGLLVLAWGLDFTQTFTATFFIDGPPFWFKFGIDIFTISLFIFFLLTAILVTGLLPAWKNSGTDFNAVLRNGTRGALGKKAGRLNQLLIISEIFVSLTVLIAAGVMTLGNFNNVRADYGADPEYIITAEVLLTESRYDSAEKQAQFAKTLQSSLENTVSIDDVMISSALPGTETSTVAMVLEGNEYSEDKGYPRVNYIVVTPGSLAKLGIELKEGRYFNSSDEGLEKRSVIVTNSFVSRHFSNKSPIGKRIRITELDGDAVWLTIIGVVAHTIQGPPYGERGRTPSVFRPFTQAPRHQMTIAMQMKSDSAEVIRILRTTLASIDPELPAFKIEPYTERIARHTRPMVFITTVFLLFGIAAVILASSGIYGVTSNTINQKIQEIGIKRALGALEQRIMKEFLMTGFKQLLWGGIPGLLAGSAMGFAMSKILGVGITGLLVVAITLIIIIGGTVLLATYLPTKHALKMEPSEALRYE